MLQSPKISNCDWCTLTAEVAQYFAERSRQGWAMYSGHMQTSVVAGGHDEIWAVSKLHEHLMQARVYCHPQHRHEAGPPSRTNCWGMNTLQHAQHFMPFYDSEGPPPSSESMWHNSLGLLLLLLLGSRE